MSQLAPLKEVLQYLLHINRALQLVFRSAPGWTMLNLGLMTVQGLLPLAALYVIKRMIDALTAGLTATNPEAAFLPALVWLIVAAGVAVLTALVRSSGDFASQAQSLLVTDAVSDQIHAHSIVMDLSYYEDPGYFDTLQRAQIEGPYRPTRIINGLVQLIQNGISISGIVGLMVWLNAWAGIILFAAALPAAFLRIMYSRRLYQFERQQTKREREAENYHWMLTSNIYAKEIRLFHLGPLFRERFRHLRQALRGGRLKLSSQRLIGEFMAQTLASLAVFAAFGFTALQAMRGTISLGDLMLVYLAFQSGIGMLQSILQGLASLYENNLFLENYYSFLDLKPQILAPVHTHPIPERIIRGLAFEDVCFTYPGAKQPVVNSVNIRLAPGEVIALVGENGSGKTTLIKLLCQLYRPESGRITLDGVNLCEMDPVAWRREISVTFQDYAHYMLPAWENIWLGDVEQQPDRERIEAAAHRSGADAVIQRLPKGYDTFLGTMFEGGKDLSTGEWQKLALARSFLRQSRIVVLDEPTSAMDPLAEAALFERFRSLIDGRSAILISHRFSTVQMADRIYVMEQGRVVECGTHADLLRSDGQYARMYHAQARNYQEEIRSP